ncbi:MAG: peptide chain release factor N(5)-glutamine methyltransferase [Syntrophorhabdaceae bacterium]
MRIKEIITGHHDLSRTDIIAAISFACNLSTEQIYSSIDRQMTGHDCAIIERCLEERRAGKPLSYITGTREFFSEGFAVNESVLIPRPETEVLVEEALSLINGKKNITLLDVGTGSGAIGIILAKYTGNRVVCTDISQDALRIASCNARSIGVDHLTQFVCADLLDSFNDGARFDMIVANLPYIAIDEWEDLMIDVKQYEPRRALYGGIDGMEIYRRLMPRLPCHLASGGHILLEIGSARQADEVCAIFKEAGMRSGIIHDYSGRERVIVGHG